MLHAKIRITTVRMAVARFESMSLTPALASTAVRPANRAESNAQWSQFICDFQRIERTTPPSTRNAAPLVAEESGLATNATMAAHLVRCGKALQERTWSYRAEELLFH